MQIELDERYWDCECEPPHSYINKKSDRLYCPLCGCREEEMPDSIVNEVQEMLIASKEVK